MPGDAFRKRVVAITVALVAVIALGAATSVLALRSTREQAAQSRAIDHRIALLDKLRAGTREIAQSARRYVLSGAIEEQQRVLEVVHAMKQQRDQLQARVTLHKGGVLEADLEEYVAALMHAMSFGADDPAHARLARFEDELVKIRSPLATTFDEIVAHERSRRDAMRSAQTLSRAAQWAVVAASLVGVMLAVGGAVALVRARSPKSDENVARSRDELVAARDELRRPLESIIAETSRLRMRARDPADANALDSIAAHASRVSGMLAELLDVTAMQRGETSLRREVCDAASLVDRAIKLHREAATERGIRLRYEAQLAIMVFADLERIRHVLDSLLQIAIASARPGAELVAHVANTEGGVRFSITETGPGTSDTAPSDLALHLCSRVVEAHGGRFGVQASSISRSYWFTLPTEPSLLR